MRRSLLLLVLSFASLAAAELVAVPVQVEDLPDTRGNLVLEFYAEQDFLKKPVHREVIVLKGVDLTVPVLRHVMVPPGLYGIGAFHDTDGDKQIDRNWLGVPRESYGWSNRIHPKWSPPTWEKVKFAADGSETVIEIVIRPW